MNQSSKRRQDRIVCGIGILGIGILGLILTLLSVMGPSEPRQVSQPVEAESFILRDSAGKIRGELSTRIDQSPKLWLYDEAGSSPCGIKFIGRWYTRSSPSGPG